jgi:hypothetical protein
VRHERDATFLISITCIAASGALAPGELVEHAWRN